MNIKAQRWIVDATILRQIGIEESITSVLEKTNLFPCELGALLKMEGTLGVSIRGLLARVNVGADSRVISVVGEQGVETFEYDDALQICTGTVTTPIGVLVNHYRMADMQCSRQDIYQDGNYMASLHESTYTEDGRVIQSKEQVFTPEMKIVDGQFDITSFEYDERGLCVRESLNDRPMVEYAYDDKGQVTHVTNCPGNQVTELVWDEHGFICERRMSNIPLYRFLNTVDDKGRLVAVRVKDMAAAEGVEPVQTLDLSKTWAWIDNPPTDEELTAEAEAISKERLAELGSLRDQLMSLGETDPQQDQ